MATRCSSGSAHKHGWLAPVADGSGYIALGHSFYGAELNGELIVELQNYNTSRVAWANVTKLKRLQTIDLRKARMLMRMVRETHNKILDKIEFAVRQRELPGGWFMKSEKVDACSRGWGYFMNGKSSSLVLWYLNCVN
ncbi:hypothetical protein Tco_1516415 [Tanacetum coccineum]